MKYISLAIILISLLAPSVLANPGDLDPTFGNGGTYTDNPVNHPCYGLFPAAMALQADGKILVVGKIYNKCSYGFANDPFTVRRVLLRRYKTTGLPDNGSLTQGGFGMDGFAVADNPTTPNIYGDAFDVVVQPDGRIVVAGVKASGSGTAAAVWRFTPQGELDLTFGDDGEVLLSSGSSVNSARKLALVDDKILVAGYSGALKATSAWVRKLNSDGSNHVWFGSGGKASTGIAPDSSGRMSLGSNTATGDIFVGGRIGASGAVVKLTSSGTIVTSFGSSGIATLPYCGPDYPLLQVRPVLIEDLRFQSTGKLIALARTEFDFHYSPATLTYPVAYRLTATGSVDPTFFGSPAGSAICNVVMGSNHWLRELPNDYFYIGKARFLPDGADDSTFPHGTFGDRDGEIQPADGKIVSLDYKLVSKGTGLYDSQVQLFRAVP